MVNFPSAIGACVMEEAMEYSRFGATSISLNDRFKKLAETSPFLGAVRRLYVRRLSTNDPQTTYFSDQDVINEVVHHLDSRVQELNQQAGSRPCSRANSCGSEASLRSLHNSGSCENLSQANGYGHMSQQSGQWSRSSGQFSDRGRSVQFGRQIGVDLHHRMQMRDDWIRWRRRGRGRVRGGVQNGRIYRRNCQCQKQWGWRWRGRGRGAVRGSGNSHNDSSRVTWSMARQNANGSNNWNDTAGSVRARYVRRGRRRPRGRGFGGIQRGRISQQPKTLEQLNKELEQYMAGSSVALDKQLEEYMAQHCSDNQGLNQQAGSRPCSRANSCGSEASLRSLHNSGSCENLSQANGYGHMSQQSGQWSRSSGQFSDRGRSVQFGRQIGVDLDHRMQMRDNWMCSRRGRMRRRGRGGVQNGRIYRYNCQCQQQRGWRWRGRGRSAHRGSGNSHNDSSRVTRSMARQNANGSNNWNDTAGYVRRGRGRPRGRGFGGIQRGRISQQPKTLEQLNKELEEYMAGCSVGLDEQLEEYMAQHCSDNQELNQQAGSPPCGASRGSGNFHDGSSRVTRSMARQNANDSNNWSDTAGSVRAGYVGRGRPRGRGFGGIQRGRISQQPRTLEQLNKELEQYMAGSSVALDKQLEEYMAQHCSDNQELNQQAGSLLYTRAGSMNSSGSSEDSLQSL